MRRVDISEMIVDSLVEKLERIEKENERLMDILRLQHICKPCNTLVCYVCGKQINVQEESE